MKAVIMAGGEGTRLRPLSLGRPKPMTPLLGRPVMEHIIMLLKGHGITDICVTLYYQPQSIMDYFGDGKALGVQLTYFIEEQPLGTAGSVKNCLSHLGQEDFLVISGDGVCDLDLSRAIRFHKESDSAATLVLYRHPTPLEYGLVLTGAGGRVERFVEKPSWGQVSTNMINTGIYVLSARAMAQVPDQGAYDFGKDLFPGLLKEGIPLYGCALEGYWCDMGDAQAYLSCLHDALSGKVALDMGLPRRGEGIWSAEPLPEGVTITPPCWIDRGVTLGQDALVGPHSVLGQGVTVGARAVVRGSVLLNEVSVGADASLSGAILSQGSLVQERAILRDGSVLGEHALVEARAILQERVKLWPGQTACAGCHLTRSITNGAQTVLWQFGDGGVLRGVLGEDLGPEALLSLGSILGAEEKVGLGGSPTPGAQMLLQAAAAGVTAAGGDAILHSLETPAQGGWIAEHYHLPASLFIEEEGERVYLHLFDQQGLPLVRSRERKLEQGLLQGEFRRVAGDKVGQMQRLELTSRQWAEHVVRRAGLGRPSLRRLTAAVAGDTPCALALRTALTAMGCRVETCWRPGIVAFHAEHGGLRLTAQDEKGALIDSSQLLTLVALIEMENGGGTVAVPASASAAIDLVAAGYGGTVLRLDRDGERARTLYSALPWLRESASAAVRICARMGVSGQRLETLISKTPHFSVWQREIPLSSDRGQVMQALAKRHDRRQEGEGLRVHTGNGWVYLVPLARRAALRVVAEGPDLELAAELCDFYAGRAAELDLSLQTKTEPF